MDYGPALKLKEYQKYEFCKNVDCVDLISRIKNDSFVEECSVYKTACNYTAKEFHDWLNENGYKIVKEDAKTPKPT